MTFAGALLGCLLFLMTGAFANVCNKLKEH